MGSWGGVQSGSRRRVQTHVGAGRMRAEDSLWAYQGKVTKETLSKGSFGRGPGGVESLPRTPHRPLLAPGASQLMPVFPECTD